MAETILIELIVDDSQLQPAIDLLEKTGQIDSKLANGFRQTTAEINKQAQAIKNENAAIAAMQKNFDQLAKELKEQNEFLLGFKEGIEGALKEAGVSLEEFFDALKNGPPAAEGATESLRTKLKDLTAQIAQLKINGEDNTEQFRELVAEAGRVKDAIGDAAAEIQRAASDTSTFDGLISAAQGVAGGFAVAQGVTALFGDESEELQKTLLKVNAAMAVLQGLQQIQNVLQKESAASQLLANRQRLITNAQIAIENGLNSTSIVVRTGATIAQKALNAAMAANPIGIVVTALAGLITLLATYGASAAEAGRQTSTLNVALDQGAKAFEDRANAIKQQGDEIIKNLELEGAVKSKISQQEIENQKILNDARKQRLQELQNLQESNTEADLKKRQELNAAIRALDDQLLSDRLAAGNLELKLKRAIIEEDLKNRIAASEKSVLLAAEGSKDQLELQKRLITAKAALELNADGLLESQRSEILARAQKERQELQAAFDKRRIELQLKNIESQLINVKAGSQEEFNLKIQQLRLQTQAEISSTKLSQAEKNAIKEKEFQEELKLQREFNEQLRKEALQGQISLNSAELANVKISSEDKLLLTISNIELAAQIEIDAAKDNANKIKEIIAKRDADIAATRLAAIEAEAKREIDLRTAREGENNRALERILTEGIVKRGRITFKDIQDYNRRRITAIQQLAEFEISNIETREKALEEERKKKLISDEEYNLRYAQLQDEKTKIAQDTEAKITGIHRDESENRKKLDQETIQLILETASQVVDVLGQLADLQNERDQQRIEGERAKVQELLESGAITEKEAIARNKRIDAEEKKLKREAAQRDKTIAIFNAIINTAQAVTRALATGGPILAAIAGAIGAAQIAIIAARPIPKFKGGKKNKYSGPGIIGEDGSEIFEHEGKKYIAHKETLVWLGENDRVYTPQETKRMLPRVDRELMKVQNNETVVANNIDYDALGKAVGKHVKVPGVTVDEHGFKVWQQEGMSRTNYMNKYYSSPK